MLMILGYANSLSLCLQKKDPDILEAMSEVKSTKQKFQHIRDDGWESYWRQYIPFVKSMVFLSWTRKKSILIAVNQGKRQIEPITNTIDEIV
jgi:hypothetical protein